MKYSHLRTLTFLLAILLPLAATTKSQTQAERDYTNLQQANRILPILAEAETVEDPSMRSFIKYTILEFVYSTNIGGVFDSTDGEVLKFYDDVAKVGKQLSPFRVREWQNRLLAALRLNRPQLAKHVETKYLAEVDTSSADFSELLVRKNVREIVDRILVKTRRGESVDSISAIESFVRKTDAAAADRIVAAMLERDERMIDPIPLVYRLSGSRPLSTETADLHLRHLRFIVKFAKAKFADGKDKTGYSIAKALLKANLSRFRDLTPELYADVQTMMTTVKSRMTPAEIAWENAVNRIDVSEDEPGQALIEAESIDDLKLRYQYFGLAVQRAVDAKQFRRAADIAVRSRTESDPGAGSVDSTIWFLAVRAASRAKDMESAEYAVAQIGSDAVRGAALGEIARDLANDGKAGAAIDRVRWAMKFLEKGDLDRSQASFAFQPLYAAFRASSDEGFDVSRRAIAIVNRLAPQKPEEKPGTDGYVMYSDRVLLSIASGIGSAFGWMASNSPELADFRLQEIRYRPWKLIAQISIERNRRYAVPQTN